jgi:alpha-beta hydrolase superfamily lysophospholipase
MNNSHTPVVFIHGLWLHAASWDPWLELFDAKGYDPYAPGWPGDADSVLACRAHPDSIADHGIEDVTRHHADIISALPEKPIVIGHSFGGMIAEKLLGENHAIAAIAIDAAQIKGVLPLPLSQLHATLPVFKNPANSHKAISLTPQQFKYSFGNALSDEESNAIYQKYTIPAPGKPLFEAATANFSLHPANKVDTKNADRGPLLLTMGGVDRTVPEAITKSTLKQYRHSAAETDLIEFADRGHSLTVDSGWSSVADTCLDWLDNHGL